MYYDCYVINYVNDYFSVRPYNFTLFLYIIFELAIGLPNKKRTMKHVYTCLFEVIINERQFDIIILSRLCIAREVRRMVKILM